MAVLDQAEHRLHSIANGIFEMFIVIYSLLRLFISYKAWTFSLNFSVMSTKYWLNKDL